MIATDSGLTPYLTTFTNGSHDGQADTSADKGGGGAGFRPHELLEAAVATCINMWLRMYADNHALPLERVQTTVDVRREQPGEAEFVYSVDLQGPLTDEQRAKLLEIAQTCPVRRTLSGALSFRMA